MKKRFLIGFLLIAVVCLSTVFTSVFAVEATDVKGDIDCDGVCNITDYRLLKRKINNSTITVEVDETKFDYNGDGSVNLKDSDAMSVSLWDINGDSKFNTSDYRMLEKYLADYSFDKVTNFNKNKCDFNADGTIDFNDLNGIANEVFDLWTKPY